ncbi:MAG: amino acid ABC transporter permease [Beijerinckiaceae bacterium]|jgi:His/Glu/Gln/Arg/opine family amino acid ABC transporter permease subunit|nr:amino acid ABC transporter permease [Beijerinckiaceae bacterium]
MGYKFDFSILNRYGPYMIEGLYYTLQIAVPSILFATLLGGLLAALQTLPNRYVRAATVFFVDIFRTVPVICLLFWVHYVLPILVGIRLTAVESAILSLSLNGAAFICEAYRGGLEAIPHTQRQASASLGFSNLQTLRYIVFPQALFATLPSITNVHITIIKTVPIAVVIAVPEVMFRAQELTVQFFRPLELYTGAAVLYVLLVICYTMLMRRIEKLRKWDPI